DPLRHDGIAAAAPAGVARDRDDRPSSPAPTAAADAAGTAPGGPASRVPPASRTTPPAPGRTEPSGRGRSRRRRPTATGRRPPGAAALRPARRRPQAPARLLRARATRHRQRRHAPPPRSEGAILNRSAGFGMIPASVIPYPGDQADMVGFGHRWRPTLPP